MKKYKVPVQSLIDHIKTACDVDPWAKEMAEELLKEHEEQYPRCEKCGRVIDHINTTIFNPDGTDSDYSYSLNCCNTIMEDGKQSKCIMFSTSQNWTGYELSDNEQKESIHCPYCGSYPFDNSAEIEFHEPVEVMMWTSLK